MFNCLSLFKKEKSIWKYWLGYILHYESESLLVMSDSLRPLDYTVHGILQARILEWVAFPFSRGSSQPRGRTQDLPIPGIEPRSSALQVDSLPA